MLVIIVLFEGIDTLTAWHFSWISWYFSESILPSTCCRFPVPEDAKQPQSTTMLNCWQTVLFSIGFWFLQTYHWSIGLQMYSFSSLLNRTESPNFCGLFMSCSKTLEHTFLVLLGQWCTSWSWKTHYFSTCRLHLCLLPASLAVGHLQALKAFSEPAFSEISLIASFFLAVQVVHPLFY